MKRLLRTWLNLSGDLGQGTAQQLRESLTLFDKFYRDLCKGCGQRQNCWVVEAWKGTWVDRGVVMKQADLQLPA